MGFFTLCCISLVAAVSGASTASDKVLRSEPLACSTLGPLELDSASSSGYASPLVYATGNGSYILGWQLSGLFGTYPYLPELCDNFENVAAKVKDTGLDIEAIKLPLCNRANCAMSNDGLNIFSNLIGYVGGLFLSELRAAVVDSRENWLTLCNSINPALTGIFLGPTNTVVPSICNLAGVSGPTAPDVGSDTPPTEAADIIHDAATLLLAWQIIAFFQRPSHVQYFCENFLRGEHDIAPNVAALDLNAPLFKGTICQYLHKPLPSARKIRIKYLVHGTEIFAETVWSVSDSSQYRRFICEGYTRGCLDNFNQPRYDVGPAKHIFEERIIALCLAAGVDV